MFLFRCILFRFGWYLDFVWGILGVKELRVVSWRGSRGVGGVFFFVMEIFKKFFLEISGF